MIPTTELQPPRKEQKETNLNEATKWSSLPSIKHSFKFKLLYVYFTKSSFFTSQIQSYQLSDEDEEGYLCFSLHGRLH